MKKLLLPLLFLPSLLVSQDLPTVYAYSGSGLEKYIDREEERRESEMNLKQEIKDLTYEISQITEKQYQEEYKGTEYEYFYHFYNEHGYIAYEDYLNSFFTWEGDYFPFGVRAVYASSTLVDKRGRYNYEVSNISDDDLRTTWVEGESDYGIGEYIEFEFSGYEGIIIYNGFQKTIDLWKNNSRVKTFKVYFNNIPLCFFELKDMMMVQKFWLYDLTNTFYGESNVMRLEIYEVYKGEKWKDVCISDILYIHLP